eukprot:TRINITY_DN392_c0_g2_i1.p1 TRINITY_DN392_c0_g2~~TRINITY_DN392_c0_g2_i1.p1  ORF type:complete len:256 (+),score=52.22 TRINITY_DN392_c0_g2_i1:164-931(+)
MGVMQDLLSIHPTELKFPFELKKQISCQLSLQNRTNEYVAFKVKTTSPKKYCVRPNTGRIAPQSSADITVTMQAQREAPPDMLCKDKFLVQSVIVSGADNNKEVPPELFSKDGGHGLEVREAKLKVLYVSPPAPPSPVAEGSEEGLSPKTPFLDQLDRFSTDTLPKDVKELHAKLIDAKGEVAAMTNRYNEAMSLSQKHEKELLALQKTMDAKIAAAVGSTRGLRTPKQAPPTGYSLWMMMLVAIIFFFIGYFMH